MSMIRLLFGRIICLFRGCDFQPETFIVDGEEYGTNVCRRCGCSAIFFDPPITIPPHGEVTIGVTVAPNGEFQSRVVEVSK